MTNNDMTSLTLYPINNKDMVKTWSYFMSRKIIELLKFDHTIKEGSGLILNTFPLTILLCFSFGNKTYFLII